MLPEGLTPAERRVLDAFEGDEYDRRRLPLTDGRRCWAYVWRAGRVLPGNRSAAEVFRVPWSMGERGLSRRVTVTY